MAPGQQQARGSGHLSPAFPVRVFPPAVGPLESPKVQWLSPGLCGGGQTGLGSPWAHRAGLSPRHSPPGALPVPPDRGQLPAGPGGILPGHLQQQDLPKCCLICCPGSLPGELVLLALLPLPAFPPLPSELHFPWAPSPALMPSADPGRVLPWLFLLAHQPGLPST